MAGEFKPEQLTDFLFDFSMGMNQGIAPALLPKNQLANAVNMTVRGTFAKQRPCFRKMLLFYNPGVNRNDFETLNWQGACYYKPDSGPQGIMAVVGGKIFQFWIQGPANNIAATVYQQSGLSLSPLAPQCWMWQSEKWAIFNDGSSKPLFWDNVSLTASNYLTPVNRTETTTNATTIPAVGANGTVDFTSTFQLAVGDIFTIQYRGTFTVLSIVGTTVGYLNLTGTPTGQVVAAGATVSWTKTGTQLPPGRMGVYGMGRNWVCLPDGKQFVASDCVGGSSGTVGNNYRDAVLNVTENSYLAGGGNFTVPGNPGDITAMIFTATLDSSLGQGPLQVLTPNTVFSCQAPVDRLTWQDITNPILTQSLIAFGGEGMNSTVNANGDIIMRSIDGVRSLLLARRDFNVWGNVPQSREIDPILAQDSPDLLRYGTAIVFDNRLLMAVHPVLVSMAFPFSGRSFVYHEGLVALNFDPLSSLSGKQPSVYDGLWTGLNILQMVVGRFDGLERAFAFCYNTVSNRIELWEILKEGQADNDDLTTRVTQSAESPVIFKDPDSRFRRYKRLLDGEIHVSDIPPGETVDFQVWYKPDEYPCWIPWRQWSECAGEGTADQQPQFRPRMGLGEPSPSNCDTITNRPFREGYYFQIKWIITGKCTFRGAYFKAVTMPEPRCAPPICDPLCPPP